MSRISNLFKSNSEKVIPFITAGFPELDSTVELVLSAERAGADMIEIGMPFSDPLADGPIIQASSMKAIENGINLDIIFKQVGKIREASNIPLILMGYINPILNYGKLEFLDYCMLLGIDGLIIPDLPPEEAEEWVLECKNRKISPILLVAPNTSNERIKMISKMAGDLIYCVAILGITGSGSSSTNKLALYLERVKENSSTPYIVGFGISNREDVENINSMSNGAVVGSALINRINRTEIPAGEVEKFIKELKG